MSTVRRVNVVPFGILLLAVFVCCITGCLNLEKSKPRDYFGKAGQSHYREHATQIQYPNVDVETDSPNESIITRKPRTLSDPTKDDIRNLRLAEAIQLALANNKIIRERNQFGSPQNPLLNASNQPNNSIYGPAIQETNATFGNRGVEAALADFDANFLTTMRWGRNETVQNNRFTSGGLTPGSTLSEDSATFRSQLSKTLGDGSLFTVSHNVDYSLQNVPSRLFGSAYTGTLQFDFRRPLWGASGTAFTQIAGPVGQNLQNIPTVFQGVLISRINNDISLTAFEANVRNMLKDVEDLYWDLGLTYQTYHSEVLARDSALGTWRNVKANFGRINFGAAEEALARDNYFDARARTENALADLYSMESQLRRMLGLPVNDGKILRPADEPVMAKFVPNWEIALAEALTRRVELRRQKWMIKQLSLQKQAAESLTKPRLDFAATYRNNGFGDTLISGHDGDGPTRHGHRNFYGAISQGDQTGWSLGVDFSIPIGFRKSRAQVRNFEIRIQKAKAAFAQQEHEISHELAQAYQAIDRSFRVSKTFFSRRIAAEERVKSFEALLAQEPRVLDQLLRAQISLSQADISYHRSLTEYNKAIANWHYRKGTLLENNRVVLAESHWTPKAYDDALRKALNRAHAVKNPYLKTEPGEFVSDGFMQTPLTGYSSEPIKKKSQNQQVTPPRKAPIVPPAPSAPLPFPSSAPLKKPLFPIPAEPKTKQRPSKKIVLTRGIKPATTQWQPTKKQPSRKRTVKRTVKPTIKRRPVQKQAPKRGAVRLLPAKGTAKLLPAKGTVKLLPVMNRR